MDEGEAENKSTELKMDVPWTFLLEEYKWLQQEILQRNTQFLVIGTAGLAGIASLIVVWKSEKVFLAGATVIVLVCLILAVLVFTAAWVQNDTAYCEVRLLEIEQYVNEKCGSKPDAQFPLSWQRRFGMSQRPLFKRLKAVCDRLRFRKFDRAG